MVRSKLIAIIMLASSSTAFATNFVVMSGFPKSSSLVRKSLNLSVDSVESDEHTTTLFLLMEKVLGHRGTGTTTSIKVTNKNDVATQWQIWEGLRLASLERPSVVMIDLGPMTSTACKLMTDAKETAFIIPSGNDALPLSKTEIDNCSAKNILFVGAFDDKMQELAYFSNFGPLVRIAASATNIKVNSENGSHLVSGTSYAAALAAAKVFSVALDNSFETGAELIEFFLATSTTTQAELNGFIDGSRLLRFGFAGYA